MLDREQYNIEREQALNRQIAEIAKYYSQFTELCMNVRERKIDRTPDPEVVKSLMDIPIGRNRRNPKDVSDEIANLILGTTTTMNHPRFFSFVTGAVSPFSIAGEALTALVNPNAGSYQLAPGATIIEEKLISWAGERAGFDPELCGGIFTSGGSLSNLTGMICGREAKLPGRYDLADAVAFCSDQAHSSIKKGMRMMGLRNDQIVIIGTDENFLIKTEELRSSIIKSIEEGKKPFLLVGTCGTTNTGSIDPLNELADIAQEFNLWFHVDGAYGGSILFSDIYKSYADGLGRADTFSWDFHKWALQTYSCSCIVARDKTKLLDAFAEHPEYLEDILSEEHNDGWNLGIEMSRPARAIKLWSTIQTMGTDLMADIVEYSFFNSNMAARQFEESEDWEIISKPMCGTFNVRYAPKSVNPDLYDQLNTQISDELIESGYAYIVTTVLNGKKCMRIITINSSTETVDVLNTVAKIKEIAEDILSRKEAYVYFIK